MLAKLSKKELGFEDNFGMGHASKDGQVDKDIVTTTDPLQQQASSGASGGAVLIIVGIMETGLDMPRSR